MEINVNLAGFILLIILVWIVSVKAIDYIIAHKTKETGRWQDES